VSGIVKVKRDGTVTLDGVAVGTVTKVQSTKTGFRRGYCVGQVPCWRYEARALEGKRICDPHADMGGFARDWMSRADAVEALVKNASGVVGAS
jgi:hypothetical protein